MKKTFFILSVIFALCALPLSAQVDDGRLNLDDGTTEDIVIKDVTTPAGDTIGRSLINCIDAYMIRQAGVIEFWMNRSDLGVLTVTIYASGMVPVASCTCDSATQPFVTLPVPAQAGDYRIVITGPEYRGEGSFVI